MKTYEPRPILQLGQEYRRSIDNYNYDEALRLNNQIYQVRFSDYISLQESLRELSKKSIFSRIFSILTIYKKKARVKEIKEELESLIRTSESLMTLGGRVQ